MPNWVENRVTIEGPSEDVRRLEKQATGPSVEGALKTLTFNGFVKQPENVYRGDLGSGEDRRYPGELNWYGWQTKYWGTKWDTSDARWQIERVHVFDQIVDAVTGKDGGKTTDRASYTFSTAWSAPHPVVEAMSSQYPTLKIMHEWSDEDRGGDNHGRRYYENGKATRHIQLRANDLGL